jgi:Concanavalin A-like lectin/glucanases superfamily
MSRGGQGRITRAELAGAVIVTITALWCGVRAASYAWHAMFMSFQPYDDEGYLLVSVREFLLGRALYNDVFTQYGPAYYAYKHALSLIQGLPTHDITRWTTLGVWLSSAALLGFAALRLTKSALAGLVTFCAMVVALTAFTNEPGHPQELVVALTAVSVAVAASRLPLNRRITVLAGIATIAALTKINIGLFIGLALVVAALPLRPGRLRTTIGVLLACLPAALMSRHLTEWAWRYAVVCGAGVLTAVLAAEHARIHLSSLRRWPILGAIVAPPVILSLYLIGRQSSLMAIFEGVLVRPTALVAVYVAPLDVRGALVLTSVAVGAIAMLAFRRHSPRLTSWQPAVSIFKVATGLLVILRLGTVESDLIGLTALVILALLVPDQAHEPEEWFGRSFLAASAAWHACAAYPVAGSQVSWSSFQVTLAAYLCLWDGFSGPRRAIAASHRWSHVAATAMICVGWALFDRSLTPLDAVRTTYASHVSLPFHGATSTRVEPAQASTFTWLVANLNGHCSDFVSLPGYNSLHVWSGLRPVTGANAGAWMHLLNDEEQIRIVEHMRRASRPCAVYHKAGVETWTTRPIAERPLAAYVFSLSTLIRHRGFELRIPPEQTGNRAIEYLLAGQREFWGRHPYLGPSEPLTDSAESTLRLWFRSTGNGTMVGLQSSLGPAVPEVWCPVIYLGADGRLRARMTASEARPITTAHRADDGGWHHVALVKMPDKQILYVDGTEVGQASGAADLAWAKTLQLGNGYSALWPEGNGSWFPFAGDLRDVIVTSHSWTPADVLNDYHETRSGGPRR